jgi:hypothetical protein
MPADNLHFPLVEESGLLANHHDVIWKLIGPCMRELQLFLSWLIKELGFALLKWGQIFHYY